MQVTTENQSKNNWGYVSINGENVYEGTFELERWGIVVLACGGSHAATTITIDGNVVAKHSYSAFGNTEYYYEIEKDCKIELVRFSESNSSGANIIVTTK